MSANRVGGDRYVGMVDVEEDDDDDDDDDDDEDQDDDDVVYSEADRVLLQESLAGDCVASRPMPPHGGDSVAAEGGCPCIADPGAGDVGEAVRRCLELNRQMQRLCRDQLTLVYESLYCNQVASETAPESGDSIGAFAAAPGFVQREERIPSLEHRQHREQREVAAPAFGLGERVPVASGDAEAAEVLRRAMPYSTDLPCRPCRWTSEDRAKLRVAVALAAMRVRHSRLLLRAEDMRLGVAARQQARARARALPAEAAALGDGELCDLLNDAPPPDWLELARTNLPRRSASECEARWLHVEHPRVRAFPSVSTIREKVCRVPFSEAEKVALEHLAREHDGHAWDDVARGMSEAGYPGRGAMACFRYYKTVVLPSRAPRKVWTHEEDELLEKAVGHVGASNWERVAQLISWVATPNQCLQRWRYCIDPCLRKGEWVSGEDELLMQAVARCSDGATGRVIWKDVGKAMPNRTPMQCRERWCNRLDPSLRRGAEWVADEDARLLGGVELLGKRWAAVQRYARLEGRTGKMVKQRWLQLTLASAEPKQRTRAPSVARKRKEPCAAIPVKRRRA
jgi:hypothetical protein